MSTATLDAVAADFEAAGAELDPATINGDLPLTREQRRAYMAFHATRNAAHVARARAEAIEVLACPAPRVGEESGVHASATPSRLAMHAFFAWGLARAAEAMRGRELRILDIGCGGGVTIPHLLAAGYRGRYVGLDIARNKAWRDEPEGPIEKTLVIGRVEDADLSELGPFDVVLSSTSLEHVDDPAWAIEKISGMLSPGSLQLHFVPGERSLRLYGPHGWRQFSPVCLRRLFPTGTIYRFGGVMSDWVHERFVTPATRSAAPAPYQTRPRLFGALRTAAWYVDRALPGSAGATMYGVVVGA